MTAISLTFMLGFAAVAVDIGFLRASHSEMQSVADASALAGASGLTMGIGEVYVRAHALAAKNVVAHQPVLDGSLALDTGYWNGIERRYYADMGGMPITPNAVYARGERHDLPLFFGGIAGKAQSDVKRDAIAVGGGGVCAGIWGLIDVWVHGTVVVDSFDSDLGNYGGNNVFGNGDLCSCQDLRVSGTIEVFGDAMFGSGHEFVDNGSSYDVWGIIGEHGCAPPAVNPDFVDAKLNNDNALVGLGGPGNSGTSLKLVSDEVLLLPPGRYYFDSVKLAGQAVIQVSGPTEIYIGGNADFSGGGIVNNTGDPKNLVVYSEGRNLKIAGGASFAGGVIAPNTIVDLTGVSEFYGMMLTEEIELAGTMNLHVDEAMIRDLLGIDPLIPILVK